MFAVKTEPQHKSPFSPCLQPTLLSHLKLSVRHPEHTLSHTHSNVGALRLGVLSVLFAAVSPMFSTLKILRKCLLIDNTHPISTQNKNGGEAK